VFQVLIHEFRGRVTSPASRLLSVFHQGPHPGLAQQNQHVSIASSKRKGRAGQLTSLPRVPSGNTRTGVLILNQPSLQRLHNAFPISERRISPFLLGSSSIPDLRFNIPCAVGYKRLQVKSSGRIVRGYVFPFSRGAVWQEGRIREMDIEGRVFEIFGCVIWVGFLRARTASIEALHLSWSDTYWWCWPVEKDSSVADGFVALDDEPDAESEEEGNSDNGVDGRLWV
jgi:hypothetical protein